MMAVFLFLGDLSLSFYPIRNMGSLLHLFILKRVLVLKKDPCSNTRRPPFWQACCFFRNALKWPLSSLLFSSSLPPLLIFLGIERRICSQTNQHHRPAFFWSLTPDTPKDQSITSPLQQSNNIIIRHQLVDLERLANQRLLWCSCQSSVARR